MMIVFSLLEYLDKKELKPKFFWGSLEAFNFLNGTIYWNNFDCENKIFFLELSEDFLNIDSLKWILRNYGIHGIFKKINAIIIGRLTCKEEKSSILIYETILSVVHNEFQKLDLSIISHVDFGHTSHQQIFSIGGDIHLHLRDGNIINMKINNPFQNTLD